MEKKVENVTPPSPPPSVGDYDDSQSTYTVDQPPPAYRKPELPSVKMTKIVAVTLLLVTLIAGLTAVAIVYMQHNLKCAQLAEAIQQKTASDLPQTDKLIQDKPARPSTKQPTKEKAKSGNPDLASAENQIRKLNFPIHIDLDEITGKMMEKNQRTRLNCVIEKKRSEEIIPRSPKTLQTPFGNLTTDPKFTHITGETMSLTCRGGNDRIARPQSDGPSINSPPGPILIQIPIQKDMIPLSPSGLPQMRPQLPLSRLTPLINLFRPPPMPMNPPQQQQQQHPNSPHLIISPSHQVNIQGPFPINPIMPGPPRPQQPQPSAQPHQQPPPHQQQQQQQQQPPQQQQEPTQMFENPLQRLLNPFQRIRIPLLPFPQLSLNNMIPHLLEIHKQIQQEREKAELQRQQEQRDQSNENNNRNRVEQRHEQDNEMNERPSEGRPMNGDHPMRDHHESMAGRGRAIPMHDNPMQRMSIVPHPPPPMEHMGPPPHLRGPMPHPPVQINALRPPEAGPMIMRGHPNPEEMANQSERREDDVNVEGAPSFQNNPHILPPDEIMYREGPPFPFIARSHNMQPRSSAHPRMKRSMAGSCSCVCK